MRQPCYFSASEICSIKMRMLLLPTKWFISAHLTTTLSQGITVLVVDLGFIFRHPDILDVVVFHSAYGIVIGDDSSSNEASLLKNAVGGSVA